MRELRLIRELLNLPMTQNQVINLEKSQQWRLQSPYL